jgi:hypothetical protein
MKTKALFGKILFHSNISFLRNLKLGFLHPKEAAAATSSTYYYN